LSTVKAWPHDVAEGESRFSVEEGPSTVKGSPQVEDCAVERPSRERRVVFLRQDLCILIRIVDEICALLNVYMPWTWY
jgi:hypothetical protein